MSAKTISQKLLADLKTSWPKTAMLLGLLGVGFWIWTPMLLKSLGKGNPVRPENAAASVNTATVPPTPPTTSSIAPGKGSEMPAGAPEVDWPSWEELLARDPLAGKGLSKTSANPFLRTLDNDPLFPLFEPEPISQVVRQDHDSGPTTPVEMVKAAPRPTLELQSTVVGSQRRAALINSRLVLEGKTFTIAGTRLRLVHVEPQRVIVEDAQGSFEVKLTRSVQVVVGHETTSDELPLEDYPALPEL